MHALIDQWSEAVTAETMEQAARGFIRCERYLAELQRRDLLAGDGCTCSACTSFATYWE